MRFIKRCCGMAMPMVLLAMVIGAGFVATMTSLNQGVRNQITISNNHQISFMIAYSAMSRVCAKVQSFSWAERPFLNNPFTENKVAMQGGFYDLFVENTAGKDFQADVYVRTHLAGISRLYFWRVCFNDDLLDVANRIEIEVFMNGEADEFPKSASSNPFRSKVEKVLKKRAENQEKSDQLAQGIIDLNSPGDIGRELNARSIKKPSSDYPPSAEDQELAKRASVPLKGLPGQSQSEKPSSPGPANSSASSSGSGVSGVLKNQAALIERASRLAEETTDKLWDLREAGLDGESNKATALRLEAKAARKEAFNGMVDFINQATAGIAEAPGSASAKAIEEYTAKVIVGGIKNLSDEMVRRLDRFNAQKLEDQLYAKTDAEGAMRVWVNWQEVVDDCVTQVLEWKSLGNKIRGFSMPDEVSSAYTKAISQAMAAIDNVRKFVNKAEKYYNKLQAEEASQ